MTTKTLDEKFKKLFLKQHLNYEELNKFETIGRELFNHTKQVYYLQMLGNKLQYFQKSKGEDYLHQCISLGGKRAYYELFILHRKKDYPKAIQYLKKGFEENDYLSSVEYAKYLVNQLEYEKAKKIIEPLRMIDSNSIYRIFELELIPLLIQCGVDDPILLYESGKRKVHYISSNFECYQDYIESIIQYTCKCRYLLKEQFPFNDILDFIPFMTQTGTYYHRADDSSAEIITIKNNGLYGTIHYRDQTYHSPIECLIFAEDSNFTPLIHSKGRIERHGQ